MNLRNMTGKRWGLKASTFSRLIIVLVGLFAFIVFFGVFLSKLF